MAKRIERVDIAQDDIFGKIKESAKNAETEVDALNLTLQAVNAQIDEIKKKALNIKVGSGAKSLADVKAVNEAEKEAIRLAQERDKSEKMRIQTIKLYEKAESDAQKRRERDAQKEAKLHAQREKQYNKEIEQANKAGSVYKQASTRLNELRNSYKDLAIQGREGEKQARDMKVEIDRLDASLKKADASVGQFQRNVGNYPNTFEKATKALSVFGLVFSGGAIAQSAFDTIKNFDESNADMAKTLGISTEEASKLSMEFTKLGSVTTIQGLQEIATIGGQFGISAGEIGGFVSSMDKLNVALGGDFGGVEETAKQLGALRNIFTDIKTENIDQDLLGIGNALNELSSKGARVEIVSDFANRISGLATPLGVTAGEILGLSATLAKLNVNAERGGTAVGTIFQRMTQDASGFAKVAGVSTEEFTNLLNTDMVGAFKLVAKSFKGMEGDNVLMSKTLESLKLTGSGASEVFLKMASNTELLDENVKLSTESLKEQDSILQEVDKKSSTVGASVARLGNSWDNFVLGVNQNTGAQQGLISFFDALSRNLPTIISSFVKLTASFVAFKTIQGVVNTDFKALISNFTNLKKGADDAGKSTGGFGNALKGVGWTVAIALAYELVAGFYEMVTASDLAAENMERLNKAVENGNKFANDRISVYKKQLEAGKIDKQLYKEKIQAEIDLARETRNSAKERAVQLAKEIEETSSWNIQRRRLLQNQLTNQQEVARREEETIKSLKAELIDREETEKSIEQENKARAKEATNQKKLDKENKELERKKQNLKDLADFEQEQADKQKKLDEEKEARQIELGILIEEAKKTDREFEMEEIDKEIQAVEDKYRRMEDLIEEFGYGQEELERAKQEELNEIRKKYAKIEQDNLDKQNEELARKEKEALERRKEMRRQFVNGVIDEMKRLSDQEEERIDQRIEAEKTLQSNLQAQANAGNISAQQSIEASKEAERKATLEKQKEQRKQQALDDIKTLYNIINQNIDKGDGVGVATTKAIAQMGIIKSVAKVFSALTGFAKGTKFRLGDEHKPMFSGVDGHVIRADSSEGIVRGDLMDKIESAGIGSMDEMAQLAIAQKLNPNFYAMNDNRAVFVPVEQKQDTSRLESRLERIEQAIKDKTEISIDPIVLAGIAKGITKTERKGNFTRKEIFKA